MDENRSGTIVSLLYFGNPDVVILACSLEDNLISTSRDGSYRFSLIQAAHSLTSAITCRVEISNHSSWLSASRPLHLPFSIPVPAAVLSSIVSARRIWGIGERSSSGNGYSRIGSWPHYFRHPWRRTSGGFGGVTDLDIAEIAWEPRDLDMTFVYDLLCGKTPLYLGLHKCFDA